MRRTGGRLKIRSGGSGSLGSRTLDSSCRVCSILPVAGRRPWVPTPHTHLTAPRSISIYSLLESFVGHQPPKPSAAEPVPLSNRPHGAASALELAFRATSATSPLLTPKGRARAASASCPRSSGPAEAEEPPTSMSISWLSCTVSVPSSETFPTRSFRLSMNLPRPRWNSPISPQAARWWVSSCRPMRPIVRRNSSLTSSLPSPLSSLSSSLSLSLSSSSATSAL
mmetsp:Transcript_112767/g.329511  ORF Transcript_112767/g.329511 Transcript_112767/m.329511 type:complete len:225 (-) Transcript_112767:492-1166(-)